MSSLHFPPDPPTSPTTGAAHAVGGGARFLSALNGRSVGTAVGLAVAAAALLNPIFVPPFVVLFGRALFLALVLLLAYAAARAWPRAPGLGWLPSGLAPFAAIAVAAPVATLAIYLVAADGSLAGIVSTPARVAGFFWIAGSGLVLGVLATLGASVRERLADARSQALQFELERSRLEKQALDARLSVLQAQIEPHFLFNTLANVQALVECGSPRAADVLKSLVAYLRAAMPRLHERTPTLADELTLVRAYLALMQMRMPDRLAFAIDVDPALGVRRFPAMALLTLVENAVRHGIDPSEDGGRIEVGGRADGAALRLWVVDTGRGLDTHAVAGTGLSNLRSRLQALHGDAATLRLDEVPPHGVRAEIVIPA